MDATKLQGMIYDGYGRAAAKIGQDHVVYRWWGLKGAVVAPANVFGTLKVSFNAEDMGYNRPGGYSSGTWYGVMDGAQVEIGDYLVGPQGTFFVAGKDLNLPILMVECNGVVSVSHSDMLSQAGAIGYAGGAADEVVIQGPWPASVLQGGSSGSVPVDSDIKNPGWTVLMPRMGNVVIATGDILTDGLGRRYAVASAELSDLGWRLSAVEVVISRQMAMGTLMGDIR